MTSLWLLTILKKLAIHKVKFGIPHNIKLEKNERCNFVNDEKLIFHKVA